MTKPGDIDALINAMCLTWRHDFGLPSPTQDAEGRMAWLDGMAIGMTQSQKDGLRLQMRQIYEHHIKPAILAAVEQEREAILNAGEQVRDDNASGEGEVYIANKILEEIRTRK